MIDTRPPFRFRPSPTTPVPAARTTSIVVSTPAGVAGVGMAGELVDHVLADRDRLPTAAWVAPLRSAAEVLGSLRGLACAWR